MSNPTLDSLAARVAGCRLCELSETRTNIVFGVGNPHAEVMLVGEAPGRQEDLGAEPFIGAAGKLLNQMLSLASIQRSDIYIANILKCRPPANRDPLPTEIEACTPYLREQVRAIAPIVLVTLGNFATRFILKTDRGISHLRGQVHITGAFSVLPTFHPAAAIYDRLKLPKLEDDFRLLGRLLEQRHRELAARADANAVPPGDGGDKRGDKRDGTILSPPSPSAPIVPPASAR
ncbi:MAG: uracil-DNA glycosylase [Coriobacteriales bacterium]|jgi:DNA polymerase|nr:uracil-DNA glycosylase [Coriobacteriales bacterium]